MNTINQTTRLDIGLSKEDQVRIEQMREVESDASRRKPHFSIREWNGKITLFLTKVSLHEKVTFFQLLSVMINAGVPIIRSLYVLSEEVKNVKLKHILHDLALEMEQGKSLSAAMQGHSNVFSEAERGMIVSGEASGNLNQILKDIAKQAEKSARIISKVKGAMIYPVSVLTIMSICLFLLLTIVVPQLTELFTSGGKELPTSTKMLLLLSHGAQNYWLSILIIVICAVLGLMLVGKSKRGKYSIHLALLYCPILGGLMRELMVSRFARMLASLTHAGVPIVKALEINANAVGNEVYKRRIVYASQDVAQGIPLGENLNESTFLFPPTVASMILVGEQTANLNEVASKIADYYEEEVDNKVASLSKVMEPVILVVMGGLVGFIVAAIMEPIMSLSDLASTL